MRSNNSKYHYDKQIKLHEYDKFILSSGTWSVYVHIKKLEEFIVVKF